MNLSLDVQAKRPVVFAHANLEPEIRPERALAVRSDVEVASGRSDYPNQVNNVLGFPCIFRGAHIPLPFDPRLRERVPAAVAAAARHSGVARR